MKHVSVFRYWKNALKTAGVCAGIFLLALPAFARTPNDPLFDDQWYLSQVHAPAAWDMQTGSRTVVVAVLDSGVDLDHPDLLENIWTNPGEIPGDGVDNDLNGFIDDVHGWDFVEDDNTPTPTPFESFLEDGVRHGTGVAGILGAVGNNGRGVAGVNWQVQIMPVRILDNFGSGRSNDAREAVRYAVDSGADIINLSFTGFDIDPAFEFAIGQAYRDGVTVVASVGNGEEGGFSVNEQPIYPACFQSELGEDWVIGVAGTDESDQKTHTSNYGKDCTDITAPGIRISGVFYHNPEWDEFTELYGGNWSGTSVAAPFISGAAALLKASHPTLSPAQIKTILQLSADPVRLTGSLVAGDLGTGRVNLERALELAPNFAPSAPSSVPAEPADPVFSTPGASTHIVSAPAAGAPPTIHVFDKRGNETAAFDAYAPTFLGGVRVAMGDVDGDGVDEIVTVPAPGGGPHVRVFEQDGTFVKDFFAFEKSDRTGWFVAVGDIDGDGREEIAISEDAGGEGEVAVYSWQGVQLERFTAFEQRSASVRVALGDIDRNGRDEVIASLGSGFSPRVRVFRPSGSFILEWDAYAPTYNKGVFVAAGDVDGDGKDEIVTGTDNGGGPHVRVFDEFGQVTASFFAYDSAFRGGVRVSVGNLNGAAASIVTAAGPGGGPHVRVFDRMGEVLGGFFTAEQANRNGIFVAAWSF